LWVAGGGEWPLSNVWLGVSVENQDRADERIPILFQIPAAVRWVSCEPLLGPIDLCDADGNDVLTPANDSFWDGLEELRPAYLNWVVCGGETGPNRRPANIEWIRSLRNQCTNASVPFFLKQMEVDGQVVKMPELDGQVWAQFPQVALGPDGEIIHHDLKPGELKVVK